MKHPADRGYQFTQRQHWGQGFADGVIFTNAGTLTTPLMHCAKRIAQASVGKTIRLIALTQFETPIWLESNGAIYLYSKGLPVRIATIAQNLVHDARRLIWGQEIAWIITSGNVIRLDVRTGNSMGDFSSNDWVVLDAVADRCDGVLVLEVKRGSGARLRTVRPEGHTKVLVTFDDNQDVVAMTRSNDGSCVHVIVNLSKSWCVISINRDKIIAEFNYPLDSDRKPGNVITVDSNERLIVLAQHNAFFAASHGLLEPVQVLQRHTGMGSIVDLCWNGESLYAATRSGLYVIDDEQESQQSLNAHYISPALHSPPGSRSGWLRADLYAQLPKAAKLTIRSKPIPNREAFENVLQGDSNQLELTTGWLDNQASEHFGDGQTQRLSHFLGDQTAEYLALRIDISLPACSEPVYLRRMDVYYPSRSIIEQLPAIYRTGDSSEAQLRRMLAPFQALADEIDELIGDSIRRVDPNQTDDIWVGFLLRWFGHSEFAQIPLKQRRSLLKIMPTLLAKRGTLDGLVEVMDALAPQGYAIEDHSLNPDFWVLQDSNDSAGARLGRDTVVTTGTENNFRLGCNSLGASQLGRICVDASSSVQRCSTEITVRVFGGQEVRECIAPLTNRIASMFAPAHTRLNFIFGNHQQPDRLAHAIPERPSADPNSLFILDADKSRALGEWRLPATAKRVPQTQSASLNSTVLDGTLILE